MTASDVIEGAVMFLIRNGSTVIPILGAIPPASVWVVDDVAMSSEDLLLIAHARGFIAPGLAQSS